MTATDAELWESLTLSPPTAVDAGAVIAELLRREREAMRSRCLEACAGWLDTSAGRAIDETIRGLQG